MSRPSSANATKAHHVRRYRAQRVRQSADAAPCVPQDNRKSPARVFHTVNPTTIKSAPSSRHHMHACPCPHASTCFSRSRTAPRAPPCAFPPAHLPRNTHIRRRTPRTIRAPQRSAAPYCIRARMRKHIVQTCCRPSRLTGPHRIHPAALQGAPSASHHTAAVLDWYTYSCSARLLFSARAAAPVRPVHAYTSSVQDPCSSCL